MRRFSPLLFILVGVFYAPYAFAQIEITEIMYDLEGGDADKEWIEIYNAGGEPVDLSSWIFYEAEVNHKLSATKGHGVLQSGEYAVIVYKAAPVTSADVLDSSFSLSNTGEALVIRNPDKIDIDSVTYSSEWGAAGDGNSLQKIGGEWKLGVPTPGAQNSAQAAPSQNTEQESSDDSTQDSSDQTSTYQSVQTYTPPPPHMRADPEPQIVVDAGARERVGIAGARMNFVGRAEAKDGTFLEFARYIWNFGDGSRKTGRVIDHTYAYPGDYVVVLDVASGSYAAMDRVVVSVVPADISISAVGDAGAFVEMQNGTQYELDLSAWQLATETGAFTFPSGTIMMPGKTIVLASNVTGLSVADEVSLLYPDGKVADTYAIPVKNSVLSESKNTEQPSNFSSRQPVIQNEAGDRESPASLIKSVQAESAAQQGEQNQTRDQDQTQTRPNIISGNTQQLAGAAGATSSGESGMFWGLVGLSLIILIAIYAILDRKTLSEHNGIKSEADLYKVIDIDS